MRTLLYIGMLVLLTAPLGASAAPGDQVPWRIFIRLAPDVIGPAASPRFERKNAVGPTDPPPADWRHLKFDDSTWWPTSLPFWGGYGYGQSERGRLLCLRTMFDVADPAAVDEPSVSLRYRGGVVVYVNGVEIGRGHMPAGDITPDMLADDYPIDAYTTGGRSPSLLSPSDYPARDEADRYELRLRKLSLPIPARTLQSGPNLLAIEIHRSAAVDLQAAGYKNPGGRASWNHLGVLDVQLAGRGLSMRDGRPGSPQALAVSPMLPAKAGACLDAPSNPVPVQMIAPRGGMASGQVMVRSSKPLSSLRAVVGKFAGADGRELEASAIELRCVWTHSPVEDVSGLTYDLLLDSPNAQAVVQPIWLTLRPPADAAPGQYAGKLTIHADDGVEMAVPLEVTVSPWRLPPPGSRSFVLELFQSPETLAAHYGVERWSDQHFALIEQSMRLLGTLGGSVVEIPLSAETQLGQRNTMVRFIQQGDSLRPDFAIVERYLDLFTKYHGQPRFVCLDVWISSMGGLRGSIGNVNDPTRLRDATLNHVPVSVWDPKTGRLSLAEAPAWTDPKAEAFWRPVFDGLRQIATKRGLNEDALALGYGGDSRPLPAQTAFFAKLLPKSGWMLRTHTPTPDIPGGSVVFASTPLGAQDMPYPLTVFPRDYRPGYNARPALRNDAPAAVFHDVPARAIIEGWDGVGGIGGDFWPVRTEGGVHGLVPRIGHLGLDYTLMSILAPGPKGPSATVRFEAMCEGIQQAEALAGLIAVLTDGSRRSGLSPELIARCQAAMRQWREAATAAAHVNHWYEWPDLRRRAEALYHLAAEVQSALEEGGK